MAPNQILTIDGKVVTNGSGGICFRPPSDTTPPTVVLENTPANRVSTTSVNITIAAGDTVAYKYKIDGGSYGAEISVDTPVQLSGLSEAEHTLYVVGRDDAGNWQSEPTTCTWVVDLTPPVAVLSNTPANQTSSTTTDITVGGEDVVAYKYKLDAGTWSEEIPATTHIQLSGLSVSAHTLSVVGKDSAGNWKPDNEATTYTWTINSFVTTSLRMHLDAESVSSYPGSGNTWYDISGYSKNATLVNGVTFTNTSPKCLNLDGVNDYITLNTSGACPPSLTVFFWIKFARVGGHFWTTTYGMANPELRLLTSTVNSTNRLSYLLYDDGAYFTSKSGSTPFSLNTWINVAMTLTNSNVKIYLNGNLDYSKTGFVYNGYSTTNASEHIMGTYNSPGAGYGGYAKASYAKFAFYDRYLSSEEILQNFNATKERFGL